jgi:hypothetical protein
LDLFDSQTELIGVMLQHRGELRDVKLCLLFSFGSIVRGGAGTRDNRWADGGGWRRRSLHEFGKIVS